MLNRPGILAALLATGLLAACGSTADTAPAGLTYSSNPAVYTKGVSITPNTPTSTGGAISSYAVLPTLPAGLALNATTGVISGTPTALAAVASYVVTATGSGGSTTASLSITVKDFAPAGLTYSSNPAVYTKGVAITPNTPTSTGGAVVSYLLSPSLPAGLAFDASTGIISGTPTVLAATATYVVTATNYEGSTTASLSITVKDAAPAGLTYSNGAVLYTKGIAITPNTPSSTGGAVASYAVSPALPAGLSLNTTTGVISGTPTVLTGTVIYAVTATNSGGSATASLYITVKDVAPAGLTYSTNPGIYTVGTAITPNTPTSTGGAITSYTVSPTLPAGLALNATTGVISGTPTTATARTPYTVSGWNGSGIATASVVMGVPGFVATGSMSVPRSNFTATLLPNGKVLVVGGRSNFDPTASAELFDPATGLFAPVGSMTVERRNHTATLLPNGKVVVVGGLDAVGNTPRGVELFDPASGQFTAAGSVNCPHAYHTATLLPNGKVLVAGGFEQCDGDERLNAELYDPGTATSTNTGGMARRRFGHSATLLSDGKVLVAGGARGGSSTYIANAEMYDPATGLFTYAGTIPPPHVFMFAPAVLLPDGRVLIAGGSDSPFDGAPNDLADLYSLTWGFAPTGEMLTARYSYAAALLSGGKVLLAGGQAPDGQVTASAELFAPATGTFSEAGNMVSKRMNHTATRLGSGAVLLVGGTSDSGDRPQYASAELYFE